MWHWGNTVYSDLLSEDLSVDCRTGRHSKSNGSSLDTDFELFSCLLKRFWFNVLMLKLCTITRAVIAELRKCAEVNSLWKSVISFPYQKHEVYFSVFSECCSALVFSFTWTHCCSNKQIISSPRNTTQLSTQTSSSTFPFYLYVTLKGLPDQCIDSTFLSPGVPDRYYLCPDMGGHPSTV